MEGLERLENEVLEMNNNNISAIFEYLKTRKELYQYFNNEEKHIEQMYEYMCSKAEKQKIGKVAMISDQMVYLWAVSYFTKSNEELGIKENKPLLEGDLEKSLINHLSSFLMELGKGFMYVGNQVRITLDNNTHYYVDLVFYNKILRSYILIDLKTDDMKPEYVGQMNMYVNYYNKEIKDEYDNETIGIILCTGKKGVTMEYALGGLSNNIFASTYTYYIPNKEELINEVEKVLENN